MSSNVFFLCKFTNLFTLLDCIQNVTTVTNHTVFTPTHKGDIKDQFHVDFFVCFYISEHLQVRVTSQKNIDRINLDMA